MPLKNVTVGTKLLLGFLSIALLVAVMGYVGVRSASDTSRAFDDAANSSVPAVRALLEIKSLANEIAAQTAQFHLIDGQDGGEEGTETAKQKNTLIARVETMNRWADRYQRALTAGEGDARLTFAQQLEEANGTVINDAFELFGLKERGISGTELEDETAQLEVAQDRLEEPPVGGLVPRAAPVALHDHAVHLELASDARQLLHDRRARAALAGGQPTSREDEHHAVEESYDGVPY